MRHSKFKVSKSSLLMALLCSSLAIGGTITPAVSQTKYRPAPLTNAAKPAPSVLQALRTDLVKQFGVQRFAVISTSAQNWPDGCLGLAQANEACTLAIVAGWRIEVTDGLQNWVYRSDRTGKVIRLENPDRQVLSQALARKLIRQVAKDTRITTSKLRIIEVKRQKQICPPERLCAAVVLDNWQVIVTGPDATFVYDLVQNGDRITQNAPASGAKRGVRVSFELFGGEIPPLESGIIFQSSTSGDLSGRMTRTVLTKDGKITLYQSSPTARFAPQVIRTLSPGQIKAFQKLLEDSRFPNLDGLSYLTTAALADYPTTTYQGMFTAVQFIDLEKKNMPQALQKVIMGWETLIQR
jgi:hypothetical protein